MNANSKIKINMDSLQSRKEFKRHKIKVGHNNFRILPPFGENSNNYPYKKWQISWGLSDPKSSRLRPYASSYGTDKKCPITEYVDKLQKKYDVLKAQMQANGETEEDVTANLEQLKKLINDLKPKTVYIYNAIDRSGEVGLLELKSTAHKKLKQKMYDYIQEYQQDPTSLSSNDDDSGVWFDFIRTGTFFDTEYDVAKCQKSTKNPNGRISYEDDRTPLPQGVVDDYKSYGNDLGNIYQTFTYDQLQEILLANIPFFIERTEYANVDSVAVSAPQKVKQNAFAKKIPLALDDNDDESDDFDNEVAEVAAVQQPKPNNAKLQSVASNDADDFLAQAAKILNS